MKITSAKKLRLCLPQEKVFATQIFLCKHVDRSHKNNYAGLSKYKNLGEVRNFLIETRGTKFGGRRKKKDKDQ